MIVAIMQPTYNPWLGYFDLIDKVDVFVFLDNVQLEKCSWQVRNKIKSSQGEIFLSIPVRRPKGLHTSILEALLDDTHDWRRKHLRSIYINYRKAHYFNDVFPFVKDLILNNIKYLADFNINFIEEIKKVIGINTPTIRSSSLTGVEGKKDNLVANICKLLNADTYISPPGAAIYIEKDVPGGAFAKNGIELYYHNYEHPVYNQLYGEFLPYMGIIDLLFNEGFENALDIIKEGRRKDFHYKEFRKNLLRFPENENKR